MSLQDETAGSGESRSAEALPIDRDLRCMQCGYNLRGLYGDPVKCPECGHANARVELLALAQRVLATLQQMESRASYSLLFGVLTVTLVCALAPEIGNRRVLGPVFVVYGPMLLIFATATVMCERSFGRACGHQPGWQRVLREFWLIGGVSVVVVVAAIIVPSTDIYTRSMKFEPCWYRLAGYLLAALWLWLVVRPAQKRLVARMEILRRAVAADVMRAATQGASVP